MSWFDAIESLDAWLRADTSAREAVRERIDAQPLFELTGAGVGSLELPEARHSPSGLRFVLVPGGELALGAGAEDMLQLCEETTHPYRPILEAVCARAQPVSPVQVRPMLCARHPLSDHQVPKELRGRWSFDIEPFPDIVAWDRLVDRPRPSVWDYFGLEEGEEVFDWMQEEYEESIYESPVDSEGDPAVVTTAEVATVMARPEMDGLRLLGEAEWEHVASAGQQQRTLADPGELSDHPTGIYGLAFGSWVSDAYRSDYRTPPRTVAHPEMARGGAWFGYPYQELAEYSLLNCAYRPEKPSPKDRYGLLLAADILEVRPA